MDESLIIYHEEGYIGVPWFVDQEVPAVDPFPDWLVRLEYVDYVLDPYLWCELPRCLAVNICQRVERHWRLEEKVIAEEEARAANAEGLEIYRQQQWDLWSESSADLGYDTDGEPTLDFEDYLSDGTPVGGYD